MVDKLNLDLLTGLSEEEAARRFSEEGANEIPANRGRGVFTILVDVVKEPMLLLLLSAGLIYLLLGEAKDALMLFSFVFVVIGIIFYQERKTEHALEALRELSSPRALVIRNGQQKRIAGREVVREDILVLAEGDRVPADGLILTCANLTIDESLLTGESVPVRKAIWDGSVETKAPGGDDLPFVYSGTLVTSGHGIIQIKAIGGKTEMGKIGKALQSVEEKGTLLQKETSILIKNFALVGLFLCLLIVIVYGLTRGNWLNGLLAGLTLSMAMLPEEFSVVLVVFLTLGAWRIAKMNVLTRRSPAIETLGATTVLCVDKTGTLTFNQMSLEKMFCEEDFFDISKETKKLPEKFHTLLEFGLLASQKEPYDPIEKAIKSSLDKHLSDTEHVHHNWNLVLEYPLSKELLALSHVWSSSSEKRYVIAAKGAPEAIVDLCHLPEKEKEEILKQVHTMAKDGLRILGVSRAYFLDAQLPKGQHDFKFEFCGLIGFADPIRPTIMASVKECQEAGIRTIMITGDYRETACSVARQIGLREPNQCITGPELSEMSDLELRERIKLVNVFARVIPEQKLRLVNALKENGEIVAMTGDGVNDAPALKSAHIGIAMGKRGTDVAREASSLVILDDDFSSIVAAVKLGRRIFDNLKKAVSYIFAVHIPIAGMTLIPVLFDLPLVLLPAHIAFLELIIDPACSTVFEAEPEESNVMKRPPRNFDEHLLARKTLFASLFQGLSVLVFSLAVFFIMLGAGKVGEEARTATFITLVLGNLGLILTNRSWTLPIYKTFASKNTALAWVLGGTALLLAFVLYIPALHNLFHFGALSSDGVILGLVGGLASLFWLDLFKIISENEGGEK